jgi:UDP-glucose 4,6-dehydratase
VHISTDEVFGENDTESPHTETSVFNPTNPYAASKAAAEMLIKAYRKSYKFPATIIRANNMYGKYQYPEKLIPKTIVRLQHGLKATIHGKGMNKRSYLSAEDFARAVKKIVTQGLDFESINVYSLEEYTNIEVINMICKEMELSFTEHTEYVDDRPFNDSRYYIRSENIGRFSWEPEATLSAEMPNLVEWYTNKYSTHKPRML